MVVGSLVFRGRGVKEEKDLLTANLAIVIWILSHYSFDLSHRLLNVTLVQYDARGILSI